jgi:O-antigen ligase
VLTGIVAAATAVLIADAGSAFHSGPLQGPFGYANATAAFFAQASVAGLILAFATRAVVLRGFGAIGAVVFAAVVLITQSWTAIIALPVLVLLVVVTERSRGGRTAVAVSAALFVAVLSLTAFTGALLIGIRGGAIDRAVRATLSAERVVLWHEALAITAAEPILGVGPGRFASASPVASSDVDLRWAHNEFLQAGAEMGLPGYGVVVGIFLWGFAALWLAPPNRVTSLASAGLAIAGIHANIDYILHFPAVVLISGAVLGVGLGAARRGRPALLAAPMAVRVREPV